MSECLEEPNVTYSAPFPEQSHVKTDPVANSVGAPFTASWVPVLMHDNFVPAGEGGRVPDNGGADRLRPWR